MQPDRALRRADALEQERRTGRQLDLANRFAIPIIIGTGVNNGVNIIYRWREVSGKFGSMPTIAAARPPSIAALAMLAVAAAAIAIAATGRARAADARAQSDQIVAQAETTIREAGKSNPVDTAKIHRAIKDLHRAIKIDPKNDSAFVDLGFCYGLLHDGPNATKMYMQAVKINPSPANYLELADIYMRVGQSEQALKAANAGITKNPRDARLYNAKGMALDDLKRPTEAAAAFQKAIDLNPNFQVARDNLRALDSGSTGRGGGNRH
jgi:Flp pilus assembly protein TadD